MCLEGLDYTLLGTTVEEPAVIIDGETLPLDDLIERWLSPLDPVFPVDPPEEPDMTVEVPLYIQRYAEAPAIRAAKPRVFIPVFPGTNCEYDTARCFERAGAEPEVLVVKNLTAAGIEETIRRMEEAIRRSQMVMLPGGFSGGDEPDGSGKFIATVFRSPRIADAVTDLLNNRDGLMLGICNGFQALIKLGLVPYGRIVDISEDDPTLTFNTLGRHISRMVYTRVTSVKSPWLAGCEPGEIHCVRSPTARGVSWRRKLCCAPWPPTGRSPPSTWIRTDSLPRRAHGTPTAPSVPSRASPPPTGGCWARWVTANATGRTCIKMSPAARIRSCLKAASSISRKN